MDRTNVVEKKIQKNMIRFHMVLISQTAGTRVFICSVIKFFFYTNTDKRWLFRLCVCVCVCLGFPAPVVKLPESQTRLVIPVVNILGGGADCFFFNVLTRNTAAVLCVCMCVCACTLAHMCISLGAVTWW